MNDSNKNRIRFVDITRGAAIILVILSHVHAPMMSWASPFFIPVFFVVSGYCTTRLVRIEEKSKKLLLPYLLFTVILFLCYRTFKPVNFVGALYARWCLYPLGYEPNVYLLRSGNGPLWFLTAMFVAFLIVRYLQNTQKPFLMGLCCLIISYAMSYLPILLPWSIDTAFIFAVFILTGKKVRNYGILNKITPLHIVIMATLYSMLVWCCGDINYSVRQYGYSLLILLPASLLGSLLLMKAASYIEETRIGHLLSKIGHESLTIFCLHIPFLDFWNTVFHSLFPNMSATISGLLVTVLILICTYPIALLFSRYVSPKLFSIKSSKSKGTS